MEAKKTAVYVSGDTQMAGFLYFCGREDMVQEMILVINLKEFNRKYNTFP